MQQQNDGSLGKLNLWLIVIALVILLMVAMFLLPGDKAKNVPSGSTKQVLLIPEGAAVNPPLVDSERVMATDGLGLMAEEEPEAMHELLPELKASDAVFFQDMQTLSEQLKPWLFKKQLIRKYVLASNSVSQGLRPTAKVLRELPFSGSFSVTQLGDKMYISEQSYHRYDALAQAIGLIDNEKAIAVYKQYEPLFQAVFNELSYPKNYQVLDIIKAAAGKVLQAPLREGRIAVIRPSVRYKFTDPKLEKLSALDKQMLRMGPENTLIMQNKLRELMEDLIASE